MDTEYTTNVRYHSTMHNTELFFRTLINANFTHSQDIGSGSYKYDYILYELLIQYTQ